MAPAQGGRRATPPSKPFTYTVYKRRPASARYGFEFAYRYYIYVSIANVTGHLYIATALIDIPNFI